MTKKVNRAFFFIVLLISGFGFFIFSSASLGLLSREGARFGTVALKQLVALGISLGAFFLISKINYKHWRRASLWIFIVSVLATLLVFVPGISLGELGGAKRWITFGGFTFQPSEFLKLGFILYTAQWLSEIKNHIRTYKRGLAPFLLLLLIVGIELVAQPDIDTLVIICVAGLAMFYVSGAKWRQIILICLIVLASIAMVAVFKPYIRARITTFLDPTQNIQSSSYQVNQSLIAIGSGGLTGRGFGQSIQKFKYLPEPIGDSIFSVAAEEFGFIGSSLIILFFLAFCFAGLRIANGAPNQWSRLVVVGIVIMVMTEAFINIASMLALIPLTGTPLLFISHGGTALFFTLVEAGIIINISRHA
ncbi:MAG: cell division protein FtsW [Candidatus Vogelbacteria bacterium]|nr:cell division protein FtsW [Candidatus Vogelbacteria bacterium]